MSNTQTNIQILHQDTGMVFFVNSSRTQTGDGFSTSTIEVGTTEKTVVTAEYPNARHVLLRLLSGDDVQVGVATGVYPLRLSGADDFMALRLDIEGLLETQTVQTVADVADSLDGTYFVVEDSAGETWAIGFGTLSHSEDNEVSVTITTGDSAATVASALYDALVADAAFSALFSVAYDAATDDDFVTITDKTIGARTNIADTGSTGFTLATTQAGAAAPSVYLKSTGTSQVQVGVVED